MIIKQNRGRQWLGWRRRMVVVAQAAGIGLCLWLLVALFFGEMGILRYLDMRDHAGRLESELSALREETASLQKDIVRLQHDPTKIEQLARERLGYVRKGETVYQLTPDPADNREYSEKP
jgi:cell division protein FtsB